MKKILPVLALAFVTVFTQSCKKEKHGINITQTISVNLEMNKSYQFDLGKVSRHGLKIEQQAAHFLVSDLNQTPGSENSNYNYTPASNYFGTDQVTIVASEKEGHGDCHKGNGDHPNNSGQHEGDHHNGSGKHHDKDDDDDDNTTTYIINFTIVNPGTAVTKNAGSY